MMSSRIIVLSIAATLGLAPYAVASQWTSVRPMTHVAVGSCRPRDALANYITDWVQHTVADTSPYARDMRARTGLLPSTSRAVVMVTDDTICAALQARFARVATSRDTLSPRQ